MKTIDLIIKQLGKVRLTCNGKHDVSKSYDDLCLVHNGKLASYISRKKVPAGIELTNEEYWQPVADLNGDVKEDYEGFKAEVLQLISNINSKVATGRIVVNTIDELKALEFGEILVGAEIYVSEEDTSYIMDSINAFDSTKTYHEYIKDAIDSEPISTDYARLPNIVADRAICDEDGRNIKETTSDMANNHNAILAINGDYYGFRTSGFVLRNGVIYRNTSYNNEDLVINSDGTFEIINENTTNLSNLLNNGALQVFSFGPALINNSNISVSTNEEVDQSMSSNPRTAIGEISPLHYVFVVSDGRTSASSGLTLYELATVMKNLGCTIAYNLDGGGSSTMYFNGNIINNPTDGHSSGERKVSDIIYVGY